MSKQELINQAWADYKEVREQAMAERDKVHASAMADYNKVCDQARTECKRRLAAIEEHVAPD